MPATKAQALKLARQRYGDKAFVRYNPKAMTLEQREAAKAERSRASARSKELTEQLGKMRAPLYPLMDAARFVCDVNGDPPSIDQLRTALDAAELHLKLTEERKAEQVIAMKSTWSYRYMVGDDGGWCSIIHGQADSWDELIEKMEVKKP